MRLLVWLGFGGLCSSLGAGTLGCERRDESALLTVSAAASLAEAMSEAAEAYQAQNNVRVRLRFASSGILARQIEAGAPGDVFCSANEQWMDYVQSRGLLRAGTRRPLWINRLAVITPADSATAPGAAADLVRVNRLAMGDPESVPAGTYARQALQHLGLWDELAPRILAGGDVRTALAFVERGEAEAGVVYVTDVRGSSKVKIAFMLPGETHDPIVYPAAVLRDSRYPDLAAAFLDYLRSTAARAVFRGYGFEDAGR